MKIELSPIGFVKTDAENVPQHWTISDVEGAIVVEEQYKDGFKDIKAGQRIVVLFYFHQSPRFIPDLLVQKPRHRNEQLGVQYLLPGQAQSCWHVGRVGPQGRWLHYTC